MHRPLSCDVTVIKCDVPLVFALKSTCRHVENTFHNILHNSIPFTQQPQDPKPTDALNVRLLTSVRKIVIEYSTSALGAYHKIYTDGFYTDEGWVQPWSHETIQPESTRDLKSWHCFITVLPSFRRWESWLSRYLLYLPAKKDFSLWEHIKCSMADESVPVSEVLTSPCVAWITPWPLLTSSPMEGQLVLGQCHSTRCEPCSLGCW